MSVSSVNFQGIEQTGTGVPYYKSNKGLKNGLIAGAIVGGLDTGYLLVNPDKIADKSMKELATKIKKAAIPLAITTFIASAACGAIVDAVRNKKAAETADKIATTDPNQLLMQVEDVEVSRYGTPYYKSSVGKKLGTLLGVGYGLATYLAGAKLKEGKALAIASSMLCGALDGFVMGYITDKITNKAAEKNSIQKSFSVMS